MSSDCFRIIEIIIIVDIGKKSKGSSIRYTFDLRCLKQAAQVFSHFIKVLENISVMLEST